MWPCVRLNLSLGLFFFHVSNESCTKSLIIFGDSKFCFSAFYSKEIYILISKIIIFYFKWKHYILKNLIPVYNSAGLWREVVAKSLMNYGNRFFPVLFFNLIVFGFFPICFRNIYRQELTIFLLTHLNISRIRFMPAWKFAY